MTGKNSDSLWEQLGELVIPKLQRTEELLYLGKAYAVDQQVIAIWVALAPTTLINALA